MGTSVRFWRWRRNPLKRGTDRVEACVRLAAGLLLVVATPAAGVTTGMSAMAHAPQPPADWHRVSAALVERAPLVVVTGVGADSQQVRATVRWPAAPGRENTGEALVRPDSPAGTRTAIWLDHAGTLRDDPTDPVGDRTRAIAYGAGAASGTVLLAGGGLVFVRNVLDRRRAADLQREWALVGPQWRRHHT